MQRHIILRTSDRLDLEYLVHREQVVEFRKQAVEEDHHRERGDGVAHVGEGHDVLQWRGGGHSKLSWQGVQSQESEGPRKRFGVKMEPQDEPIPTSR